MESHLSRRTSIRRGFLVLAAVLGLTLGGVLGLLGPFESSTIPIAEASTSCSGSYHYHAWTWRCNLMSPAYHWLDYCYPYSSEWKWIWNESCMGNPLDFGHYHGTALCCCPCGT